MQSFYISFGGGSPLANCLIQVQGADQMQTRLYAAHHFEKIWCAVYNEKEAQDMIDQYGLQVVKANPFADMPR